MKKFINIISIAVLVLLTYSCGEDSLEPTLAQNKDVETSINNVDDLEGVLFGAYNRMTHTNYYGRDYIIYEEVRSDNCYANGHSGRFISPASMEMDETDRYARDTWTKIYQVIANANIVISKEDVELEGDADKKSQIIGQAYAIRALAHFDLLKLFGQQNVSGGNDAGIPYVTEYKGEDLAPARNTVSEIKTFINDDLQKALNLMKVENNPESKEFISTYAVNAIKARVAIYFKDWNEAKTACLEIINSGVYSIMSADKYVESWTLKNNSNSIFELAFSSVDNMNINGLQQIYRGDAYGDIRVLDDLVSIFDAGDVRNSAQMIGYDPAAPSYLTNLGKYPATDYSDNIPLFRYEEVILNYAEALYELNNSDPDALDYLNMVPQNRGATLYAAVTKDNILKERRREFCFEGFRFDDLARTGNDIPLVDPINQRHSGPDYGSYNYAYPIPKVELNANPNIQQNNGY